MNTQIPSVRCGNNCLECGRYSRASEDPAYLYLLNHPQLKLHKIGIGTVGEGKGVLHKLMSEGWLVHGIWHHRDKQKTFRWEGEIFNYLEIQFSSKHGDGGILPGRRDRRWVESVTAELISVSSLALQISKIVKNHND